MKGPLTIASRHVPAGTPEESVRQVLSRVIDPELGVPITELGLVYSVVVEDGMARIVMTTTTPVCPLGEYLRRQIERHLAPLPTVTDVVVTIVHDPPWSPDMMTDGAREMLGHL